MNTYFKAIMNPWYKTRTVKWFPVGNTWKEIKILKFCQMNQLK